MTSPIRSVSGADSDSRPIGLGVAATTILTIALYVAMLAFPADEIRLWLFHRTGAYYRFGNPLGTAPFFGGFFGGCVAGYLSRDSWVNCARNGLYAGVLGTAVIGALLGGITFYHATILDGMFPPPVIEIVLLPQLLLAPLFVVSVVTGFVGGAVGHFLADF